MDRVLKYKQMFNVDAGRIVDICRTNAVISRKQRLWAMKTLAALGVPYSSQREAILAGHADIVVDDDGWLCYIDHRVTKEVMSRLTGK
jgi:hypothetical protein